MGEEEIEKRTEEITQEKRSRGANSGEMKITQKNKKEDHESF